MSDSPSRLFSWVSKPGDPDPGADAERVREHAGAAVGVDGDHVRRVLAAAPVSARSASTSARTRSVASARERRQAREQLREAREAARGSRRAARVLDDVRRRATRAVRGEIGGLEDDARPPRGAPRRAIRGRRSRALLGQCFEGLDEPGLARVWPSPKSAAVPRVERGAAFEGEELADISSVRACISGQRDAGSRQGSSAGSHSRSHGSRPSRSQSSPSAAGSPAQRTRRRRSRRRRARRRTGSRARRGRPTLSERRRSRRGSATRVRRMRSHDIQRGGRSSRSRRRTTRAPSRRRRRPPCRRPRGSPRRPRPSPDARPRRRPSSPHPASVPRPRRRHDLRCSRVRNRASRFRTFATLPAVDRAGRRAGNCPRRNVISRSGHQTANTLAKIASPSTGPNVRLSIAPGGCRRGGSTARWGP